MFSASANVAEQESFGEVESVLEFADGSFLQLKINIPKIKKIHLQERNLFFIGTNLIIYMRKNCARNQLQ